MTNPFNNPFDTPDFGAPPAAAPQVPAASPMYPPPPAQPSTPHYAPQFAPTALPATALPSPWRTVRKAVGWVVLLFGALIAIAALVDWSEPGMSIAMTFFAAAFILTGATMIWKMLPWRIAGPAAGVLFVICIVIVGIVSPDTADNAALAITLVGPE